MVAGIGLQWKLDGLAPLQRALTGAARAAEQPNALLIAIGTYLLGSIKKNFETRGDGTWKAVNGSAFAPLRSQRDRLFKAATQRGAAGNVFEVGRNYVRVGVDRAAVKYARIHQTGGVIKAKNWFNRGGQGPYLVFRIGTRWVLRRQVTIPARPYAFIRKTDPANLSRIAGFWMRDQLKVGLVGR